MKHLKIHKFPFKNVIVLAIDCKMYLKIQQKLHCLGCISKQTMRSVVKKTRLNSSKDDILDKKLPFLHKKKAEHSSLSLSEQFIRETELNGKSIARRTRNSYIDFFIFIF